MDFNLRIKYAESQYEVFMSESLFVPKLPQNIPRSLFSVLLLAEVLQKQHRLIFQSHIGMDSDLLTYVLLSVLSKEYSHFLFGQQNILLKNSVTGKNTGPESQRLFDFLLPSSIPRFKHQVEHCLGDEGWNQLTSVGVCLQFWHFQQI